MEFKTQNYGITGGPLDATKHILAAIPRLLKASEISEINRRDEFCIAVTSKKKRDQLESN